MAAGPTEGVAARGRHRPPERGQVDPDQCPGRRQGQHRLQPPADHASSPAGHRHVSGRPAGAGRHPRPAHGAEAGDEPGDEPRRAWLAGRRRRRPAGDRSRPLGRRRQPGLQRAARCRHPGGAGGQQDRSPEGKGRAAAVPAAGDRRPRFCRRAPDFRAEAQWPGSAGARRAEAAAGSPADVRRGRDHRPQPASA
ncbi:hypothetical protein G6F59_013954 [Rhizopus arrhizus]|nr:hypothetical protein G6F59_013954 [Rhizopus arrhizus]